VIIAVVAMPVVQPAIDKVVRVISVWHGFMTAAGTMDMVLVMASSLARAAIRIFARHIDKMLVDMVTVRVVQMPVMKIINMTVVKNRGVPAAFSMLVRMPAMGWMSMGGLGGHALSPRFAAPLRPGSVRFQKNNPDAALEGPRASNNPTGDDAARSNRVRSLQFGLIKPYALMI
jgi:hypothetical protein